MAKQTPKNKHNKKTTTFSNQAKFVKLLAFSTAFALIGVALLMFTRASSAYQEFRIVDANLTNSTDTVSAYNAGKILEYSDMSASWFSPESAGVRLHFYNRVSGKTSILRFPGYLPGRSVWLKHDQIAILERKSDSFLRVSHIKLIYDASGMPVTWELEKEQLFGDVNSRVGDMIQLKSGGIVVTWNQQEGWGTYERRIAYLSPGGSSWQVQSTTGIRGDSARSALAQHPADNSVWMFGIADAWGRLSLVHMVETGSGLVIDKTVINVLGDLNEAETNLYGMDPEIPHIQADVDTETGEIVLGYQSQKRDFFWNADRTAVEIGSYPAFARFKADYSKTFMHLPVYIERVSAFSFTVDPSKGLTILYNPLDTAALTHDTVAISRFESGSWSAPINFGKGLGGVASTTRTEFTMTHQASLEERYASFITFETDVTPPIPPADVTPPTEVKILSPTGGTVTGTITVTISAKDNNLNSIGKVELVVDGALAGVATASPYSVQLDTTKLGNGSHTMYAKGYDLAGNTKTSFIVNFNVYNTAAPPPADTLAPVVNITSPVNNAKVGSSVSISATATDNVRATRLEIYVDGKLATTSSTTSINYNWNTKRVKRGAHTILVKAYDAAGNIGSSQIIVYK